MRERLQRIQPEPICLKLDSVLTSVQTLETMALSLAEEAGFDADTSSQISMVVREAAVNAITHGNQHDARKQVTARMELTETALSIHIADEGAGLALEEIPDPLAEENLMRTSGRGVFLMRAIMDEVHFDSLHPGTGITLVKHRVKGDPEA